MPPPELSADAPILNVTHPGKISVLPLFWYEFDTAVFNRLDRGDRELFRIDVPLVGEVGFNDNA